MEKDWYCAQVIPGTAGVEIVAENEHALALLAPEPLYPVHVIVIPKRHIRSLVDAAPGDQPALVSTLALVQEMAASVEAEHGACQVFTNLGAYQHNKHLHWHVVVHENEP